MHLTIRKCACNDISLWLKLNNSPYGNTEFKSGIEAIVITIVQHYYHLNMLSLLRNICHERLGGLIHKTKYRTKSEKHGASLMTKLNSLTHHNELY